MEIRDWLGLVIFKIRQNSKKWFDFMHIALKYRNNDFRHGRPDTISGTGPFGHVAHIFELDSKAYFFIGI